jgi:hypothetical protein
MSRINRKNWSEEKLGLVDKGGMLDLFDNAIKGSYRITDKEYDEMCVKMSEEEIEIFTNPENTFTTGRLLIGLLNKYIDYTKD